MSSTANITATSPDIDCSVKHRQVEIDGIDTFY